MDEIEVTIGLPPVVMTFHCATIADVLAMLQKDAGGISQIQAFLRANVAEVENVDVTAPATTTKGKPGRKSAADKAAALAASAPPPVSIPGAAPPAPPVIPVDLGPVGANGIPAGLDRTAPPAPPAPPVVVAPPAPPAPPPGLGVLAPKMIAELKRRSNGDATAEKGLVDWLAVHRLVASTATFEEANQVIQFSTDAQLQPLATALGIV